MNDADLCDQKATQMTPCSSRARAHIHVEVASNHRKQQAVLFDSQKHNIK